MIIFSAKATIGTSPAATSPAAASPTARSRSPARRRRLGVARGWRTKGRGDAAPGARMRQEAPGVGDDKSGVLPGKMAILPRKMAILPRKMAVLL